MWKVKLEEGVWIAEAGTTTDESKALLMPDIPAVQAAIKKARKRAPYPMPVTIADDGVNRSPVLPSKR